MCGESRTHGVEQGKTWRLHQRVTYRYYLQRNNMTQKQFVIGLIETEMCRAWDKTYTIFKDTKLNLHYNDIA